MKSSIFRQQTTSTVFIVQNWEQAKLLKEQET